MNKKEFRRYIQKQYQGKHPYQTVEYNGEIIHRGTERCWLSWENIQRLGIDWSGKKVCDIGSYFGYFSTKVLRAGAKKLVAVDQNAYLLKVCSTVLKENGFSNYKTAVKKFRDSVPPDIPGGPFDVIMILNVLHHIKKHSPESFGDFLRTVFNSTKEVVFEINEAEIVDVLNAAKKTHYEAHRIKSHRRTQFGQRWILHLVNK